MEDKGEKYTERLSGSDKEGQPGGELGAQKMVTADQVMSLRIVGTSHADSCHSFMPF